MENDFLIHNSMYYKRYNLQYYEVETHHSWMILSKQSERGFRA